MNVMIDIESLAIAQPLEPNVKICQIGLAAFDEGFEVTDKLCVNIDTNAQINRIKDKSTMSWWANQPKEVIKSVFTNQIHPEEACDVIINFLEKFGRNKFRFWSNHILFDIPAFESFLQDFSNGRGENLYRYNQIEDYATLIDYMIMKLGVTKKTFFEEINDSFYDEYPDIKSHNAIDDCIYQIYVLKFIDRALFGDAN